MCRFPFVENLRRKTIGLAMRITEKGMFIPSEATYGLLHYMRSAPENRNFFPFRLIYFTHFPLGFKPSMENDHVYNFPVHYDKCNMWL